MGRMLVSNFRNGNLFLWSGLFLVGSTAFVLAYRHSLFFGWTHPKGGEPELISILIFAFTLMVLVSYGSTKKLLGSLALIAGSALGFVSPWAFSGSPYWFQDSLPPAEQIWDVKRVAHAGGLVKGLAYTNSIEALEANKHYFDYFEIDFSVTTDSKLVCLHGWGEPIHEKIFGDVIEQPVSLADFQTLNGSESEEGGITACEVSSLKEWLSLNPGKHIVTDIKGDENLYYLGILRNEMGTMSERIIPQIYSAVDIESAKNLGFRNVILTTYRMDDSQLREQISNVEPDSLFAITVPLERSARHIEQLLKLGTPVYAHTVNDLDTFSFLRNIGISNVYTDTLIDTTDGY